MAFAIGGTINGWINDRGGVFDNDLSLDILEIVFLA